MGTLILISMLYYMKFLTTKNTEITKERINHSAFIFFSAHFAYFAVKLYHH